MAGLAIFVHALRMVLGNLGAALRIGLLPQIMLAALAYAVAGRTQQRMLEQTEMPMMPDASLFAGSVVVLVAQMLISIWVAVAWHRYILLEEQPGAVLPGWNGTAIWAYFKATLVLAIIIVVLAIPLVFVAGIVGTPIMMGGGGFTGALVFFVIVGVPLSWVGYRLSPVLPGAAIGERRTLGEAWSATAPASGAVILLALLSVAGVAVLQLPLLWLGHAVPILSIAWNVLVTWLTVMVGVGIITTLYGHYVQGRPLNA